MFGSSSQLSPLVAEGGGPMCDSISKADLLSDHFDSKQSRESVDLQPTCHPSPSLTTFAFRSSDVRGPRLDLDPCMVILNTLSMFPLFLKRTADVLAHRVNVVFRRLLRLGCLPACCRQSNVPQNRPINGTMSRSGALLTTYLAYRNCLGTCNALLSGSHRLQSALESGQQAIGLCK